MKVEVVANKNNLNELLNIHPITYLDSVKRAFDKGVF